MPSIESIHGKWTRTILFKAFAMLPRRDRIKTIWISIIQVVMSLLDLAGVVMIGALGALSVQSLESKTAGNKVSVLLRILHVNNLKLQSQVAIIGVVAALILVTKTLFSVYFTRKTYFFLSRRGAQLSADTIGRLLSQNLLKIQTRTTQQTLFMITSGIQDLMIGVLATTIQLVSDSALLIIMVAGLLFVDPVMAVGTMIIFGIVGYSLHRLLEVRAREIGKLSYELTVASNEKILEVLNSYRESVVRNRRAFYANEIGKIRFKMADNTAELSFMPYISKYVMDSTSVLGSLILGAFEFSTNNAVHALSVMAVFIVASSRIAPAALRIQQSFLVIKNSRGAAEATLVLVDELKYASIPEPDKQIYNFDYKNFDPEIRLNNVTFTYPNSNGFALVNVNLEIPSGSSVAVVGPSGAGKTTLIDLILGVLDPTEGSVEICHVSPSSASSIWPGAIAYVPQDVVISNGSIRENIGLGYPVELATDARIEKCIDLSQLSEMVTKMPTGADTQVGENGAAISGGQRQRLGIARSLFTNPKLMVLDEATSALDGQTEADLSDAIQSLKGDVTVLVVAHRLSTIRHVDQVVYMEDGKIRAVGTFDQVRQAVPAFDAQALLMGL